MKRDILKGLMITPFIACALTITGCTPTPAKTAYAPGSDDAKNFAAARATYTNGDIADANEDLKRIHDTSNIEFRSLSEKVTRANSNGWLEMVINFLKYPTPFAQLKARYAFKQVPDSSMCEQAIVIKDDINDREKALRQEFSDLKIDREERQAKEDILAQIASQKPRLFVTQPSP